MRGQDTSPRRSDQEDARRILRRLELKISCDRHERIGHLQTAVLFGRIADLIDGLLQRRLRYPKLPGPAFRVAGLAISIVERSS